MKSLRKSILMAAILFSAVLAVHLSAQQAPPSPAPAQSAPQQDPQLAQQVDGQARIRVPVNLVVVPVIVKDGAGRIVADLRRDEFRILEDKVEQRVSRSEERRVGKEWRAGGWRERRHERD